MQHLASSGQGARSIPLRVAGDQTAEIVRAAYESHVIYSLPKLSRNRMLSQLARVGLPHS